METTLASGTTAWLFTQFDGDTSSLIPSKQAPHKRNRIQLSCTNCRQSKLKCDRQKPHCSQCEKKGRASLCTFPSPAARKKPKVSMQNRLKHLESLVKDVMSTGQGPPMQDVENHGHSNNKRSIPTAIPVPVMGSSGQVLLGSTESTYVGATHWAAILEDIDEMRSYLDEEAEDEEEALRTYTSLVFNARSPTTKLELLAALPSRTAVDLLVSRYFNSNSPALPILHRPSFQRNYRKFWAHPEGTPVIFLGLLFSIMMVATLAGLAVSENELVDHTSAMEAFQNYRECCIQCLVLSNYTKSGPYSLETVFIYMESEFLVSKDDQVQSYLLVGNAVRLALRMGLHRDSTKVGGNITPFQGEIRRRLWHHLLQLDLLCSFHIGLPGMVPAIDSDTMLPGNLQDEDFDEESAVLPQSRPESELTPISYSICKSRLCYEAGRVVTFANRLSLPEYDEVLTLDKDLLAAYQKVPVAFLLEPTGPSITDSPATTIKRLSLAILFHKSRCMLHRKHLMRADQDPNFAFSKRVSLEAAMELLRCQTMVHDAALPGGQLSRDRWLLSSLSMHDFLLAAMIVYLSLSHENANDSSPAKCFEERQGKIKTLEKSQEIWNQNWTVSAESKKASMVLGMMLRKAYSRVGTSLSSSGALNSTARFSAETGVEGVLGLSLDDQIVSHGQIVDAIQPSASFASSTEDTTPCSRLGGPIGFDHTSAELAPLDSMFDVPADFDWEMFDTQLRPQDTVDPSWPDLTQDFTTGNGGYYNF